MPLGGDSLVNDGWVYVGPNKPAFCNQGQGCEGNVMMRRGVVETAANWAMWMVGYLSELYR